MAKLRKDLTGKVFGYLTVMSLAGRRAGKAQWSCTCRCGMTIDVDGYNLSCGHTVSCGCKRKEAPPGVVIHGRSKTRAHQIWRGMLRRCFTVTDAAYPRYGGRGITVCDRWLEFVNFHADMGDPPEGTSIDRFPDRNGNYEPGNCRWANDIEQAINKDSTRRITKGGESLTIREWCERLGLKQVTIEKRIEAGWPRDRLLDPPTPKAITHRDSSGRIAPAISDFVDALK